MGKKNYNHKRFDDEYEDDYNYGRRYEEEQNHRRKLKKMKNNYRSHFDEDDY